MFPLNLILNPVLKTLVLSPISLNSVLNPVLNLAKVPRIKKKKIKKEKRSVLKIIRTSKGSERKERFSSPLKDVEVSIYPLSREVIKVNLSLFWSDLKCRRRSSNAYLNIGLKVKYFIVDTRETESVERKVIVGRQEEKRQQTC